jgi:hypothetical protein
MSSTLWLLILGRIGESDPTLGIAAVCLALLAQRAVSRIRFQTPKSVGADVRPFIIQLSSAIQLMAGIAIYHEQNP